MSLMLTLGGGNLKLDASYTVLQSHLKAITSAILFNSTSFDYKEQGQSGRP